MSRTEFDWALWGGDAVKAAEVSMPPGLERAAKEGRGGFTVQPDGTLWRERRIGEHVAACRVTSRLYQVGVFAEGKLRVLDVAVCGSQEEARAIGGRLLDSVTADECRMMARIPARQIVGGA